MIRGHATRYGPDSDQPAGRGGAYLFTRSLPQIAGRPHHAPLNCILILYESLRIDWENGMSRIDVGFYAKGDNKSQVSLQHSKLADAAKAEQMKAYWSEALDRLKRILEA